MSQIILGLVGPIASGKGVLVDHLRSVGFSTYSLSDVVREEAKKRGLKIEREVLQNIGDELRRVYGGQVLAERILDQVIDVNKNIVFDSIRNPSEIKFFQYLFDIKIIGVDAPVDKRIIWYRERAKMRGEDNPDMGVFIQSSLRDRGIDQPFNGQQVDKCLEMADIKLINDGMKSEITRELDLYLSREFSFDPEINFRAKEK